MSSGRNLLLGIGSVGLIYGLVRVGQKYKSTEFFQYYLKEVKFIPYKNVLNYALRGLEFQVDFTIDNPTRETLKFQELFFQLSVDGKYLGSSKVLGPLEIKAQDETTIKSTVNIPFTGTTSLLNVLLGKLKGANKAETLNVKGFIVISDKRFTFDEDTPLTTGTAV